VTTGPIGISLRRGCRRSALRRASVVGFFRSGPLRKHTGGALGLFVRAHDPLAPAQHHCGGALAGSPGTLGGALGVAKDGIDGRKTQRRATGSPLGTSV